MHGSPTTSGATANGQGVDWRDALLPLTARSAAKGGSRGLPLALLIEVRERTRRGGSRGRWEHVGDTTRTASAASVGPLIVTARPGVPGKRGAWVNAPFGWNGLQYRTHELGLDPAQVRWFVEFDALSRAEPGRYSSGDGARLVLDDYASPLLWRMLADAPARGISLAMAGGSGALVLGTGSELGVSAQDATHGGLVLRPRITIDGVDVPAAAVVRPIGDHGLAAVQWRAEAPLVTLAPTPRPVSTRELALLSGGEIRVPAPDVPEFVREVYPRLARALPVARAGATRLPELAPPTLVVTVAYEPGDRIRVDLAWEYRTGEHVDRVAVAASPDDRLPRDAGAETDILARMRHALRHAGDPAADEAVLGGRLLEGADAAQWATDVLPAIEALAAEDASRAAGANAARGIRVEVIGERVGYRELTGEPELQVTTVPTDQPDWFDLGVIVTVSGKRVPFLPLFRALADGRRRLLLADSSHLSLNRPVFDRLKELLAEAEGLAEWDTGPRISRYQASLWADFEDLADRARPAVAWRQTVSELLAFVSRDGPDRAERPADVVERTPLPRGLVATLRPYQRDGYDWLAFLWRHGLGGVLADDMGLGKTLQTLALIAHARQSGASAPAGTPSGAPFLVLAPASVVSSWADEAARFTPGLRVASATATRRTRRRPLAEVVSGADVVLTTYAVFRLDHAEFADLRWSGLVLDEAQVVKNHASLTHRLVRELDVPFRLAVTGTPLENSLLELWAILQIVAPGLFPSRRRFVEEYVGPIAAAASLVHGTDASHGAARMRRLRRRIRPLMLRRTKDVVAPELPQKQEQVLSVPLHPRHRALYDAWLQRERQKVLGLLGDLDRQRFIVYRSITLLRMLAVDASLIDPANSRVPSSKLDALLEQLGDVVAEGHRALVFSQFTSYLRKVADRLDGAGIRHSYLDGSTRRRAEVIRDFREGDAPVFLISLKAGGFGLTLTEADYVFVLDPWWNPAAEAQAIDRTHRIGQTRRVMVYRMVAADTIEEKVMRLGRQKARLFDAVLGGDVGSSPSLSADDIRALLM